MLNKLPPLMKAAKLLFSRNLSLEVHVYDSVYICLRGLNASCVATFNSADPSLTALANEVDALRAALLQKEQQVQSLTRPISLPVNPPFITSGLATMPGVATTQTYVPGVTPAATAGTTLNGATTTRTVPIMSPMATTSSGLGTNRYVAAAGPGEIHHHHYYSKKTGRGTQCMLHQ